MQTLIQLVFEQQNINIDLQYVLFDLHKRKISEQEGEEKFRNICILYNNYVILDVFETYLKAYNMQHANSNTQQNMQNIDINLSQDIKSQNIKTLEDIKNDDISTFFT